jgi:transposase-like protein
MKKKFTEEQIVRTLTRFRNGEKATDLARELNVASHTIYDWRKRFAPSASVKFGVSLSGEMATIRYFYFLNKEEQN